MAKVASWERFVSIATDECRLPSAIILLAARDKRSTLDYGHHHSVPDKKLTHKDHVSNFPNKACK